MGRLTEEARGPGQNFSLSPERQRAEAGKENWETHCLSGEKGKGWRYGRSTQFNVNLPSLGLDTPVCKSSALQQPLMPTASVSSL